MAAGPVWGTLAPCQGVPGALAVTAGLSWLQPRILKVLFSIVLVLVQCSLWYQLIEIHVTKRKMDTKH